jgi:alpha-galactosidase
MFVILGLLMALLVPSVHGHLFKARTPPMGWNSYNGYTCDINEDKVKMNAQALINMGLKDLGYTLVTTDCAWNARERDSQGRMQWNSSTFPSGGKALGVFLHSRGLKFGMYSGAGYKQCNPYPIAGSRGASPLLPNTSRQS